jgi:hypothetical protein
MRMKARPRDWPRTLASRRTTRHTKKRAEQSEPDVPGQDVAGSQQVSGTEVERVHHQLIAFIDGCVACLFDRTDLNFQVSDGPRLGGVPCKIRALEAHRTLPSSGATLSFEPLIFPPLSSADEKYSGLSFEFDAAGALTLGHLTTSPARRAAWQARGRFVASSLRHAIWRRGLSSRLRSGPPLLPDVSWSRRLHSESTSAGRPHGPLGRSSGPTTVAIRRWRLMLRTRAGN